MCFSVTQAMMHCFHYVIICYICFAGPKLHLSTILASLRLRRRHLLKRIAIRTFEWWKVKQRYSWDDAVYKQAKIAIEINKIAYNHLGSFLLSLSHANAYRLSLHMHRSLDLNYWKIYRQTSDHLYLMFHGFHFRSLIVKYILRRLRTIIMF